jgi:hypothetical protein
MASAVWKVSNVGRPRKANRAVYERPQKPAYAAVNLHAPALPSILVTPDDEEEDDRNCGLRASRSTPHFTFSTETTAESRIKSTRAQNSQTSLVPPSPAPSTAFEPPSPASTSDLLHGAFVENLGDEVPSRPVMGKNWKQMQVRI